MIDVTFLVASILFAEPASPTVLVSFWFDSEDYILTGRRKCLRPPVRPVKRT